MSTLIAQPPLNEARRELSGMLSVKELGAIPVDILVEHLLSCYADATWPVLREAAHALLRRAASVKRDVLRVSARPGRGRWGGVYRTRRAGQAQRPYETCVACLRPLRVSCDCPDYLQGGLGLCKHGLAVLGDIATRPRVLARALSSSEGRGPSIVWNPIRPLEGPGDWLEGVRVRDDGIREVRTRRLFEPAQDCEQGWLRIAPPSHGSKKSRAGIVELLRQWTAGRRDRDPAVRALLRREHDEASRNGTLLLGPREIKRSLRGFGLQLYPYQRRSLEQFLETGRMLLADDMGLGKTVQAAAIGHTLAEAGKIRRVLVLAPASLKSQWVREWRRATDFAIEPVEGSPENRRALYQRLKTGVLVANYEQLLRDLGVMQAWAPELVILDEAQRIKNWATQTAQRVKQLDVPYRLVLTGTPMENRLSELASIMDWIDPFALAPKWRLAPVHNVVADGARDVVGVRRLDVLRSRLEPRMLRRRRSEILSDLPERTDTVRTVAMTDAQQIEHDELAQPIAKIIRAAGRRPLTQPEFLRLMSLLNTQRVIANGIAQLEFVSMWPGLERRPADEATLASLAMPKLEQLRDLVESVVIDQGRKIVVFSQWRRALCLANWTMKELLAQAGVRSAFFTGAESQQRRTHNIVDFHDDPALRVLLCTDAGGVGLNLQRAASCCVNFELPWNPAILEQRVARLHRLGQPDPVDVYTFVSEPSIEGRIASAVANKRALFSGLFDGGSDEIHFEGSASFLATVQAIVDPAGAPPGTDPPELPGNEDAEDPDADLGDTPHVDDLVASADEHIDTSFSSARPKPTHGLPDAEEVRALFSQLRVEPRADGSLHMEASPQAARSLSALFAGMAELLAQGSTVGDDRERR